jgi:FlaA1/EpsC-like NDP-sugar epimerase
MSKQLSFKGHTVVVTGAGGGLGKASVYHLELMTSIEWLINWQLLSPLRLSGS